MIQDVLTRWNSTYRMLKRARKLKPFIDQLFDSGAASTLEYLEPTEWRQVDYLIELLQPFAKYTAAISATNGPTVHQVLDVYNDLFDHLDEQEAKLARKRLPWKVKMYTGLGEAKVKLTEYYSQTQGQIGHQYAIASILSPIQLLQTFEGPAWADDDWVCIRITTLIVTTQKLTSIARNLQAVLCEHLSGVLRTR
jgi:hypothetical protein